MSYERSPRPSLVMTVGTRFMALTPCLEADARFRFGWRVCHSEIGAEVGDAAQRLEGQGRRGQPELDRRILRPGALLRVRAQHPREDRIYVRGAGPHPSTHAAAQRGGDLRCA